MTTNVIAGAKLAKDEHIHGVHKFSLKSRRHIARILDVKTKNGAKC